MSTDVATLSEKQLALEALLRMPESVTLDQISEEMAILAAIRKGEAAADAGRVIPHEEVVRRSATWTSK
jgi:predicted transcriptional regulator